jgi:DNA-binding transcriptional ArsR family regulator
MLKEEIKDLAQKFADCQDVLVSLGDETRIHILLQMLKVASEREECTGLRVGEICAISNLSRPAVSHHMKILKDAGIVKCRRSGSMNFYYLDAEDTKIRDVIQVLTEALEISAKEKH